MIFARIRILNTLDHQVQECDEDYNRARCRKIVKTDTVMDLVAENRLEPIHMPMSLAKVLFLRDRLD
jgi:hypothetical protein